MSVCYFEYHPDVAARTKGLSVAVLQSNYYVCRDAVHLDNVDVILNFTGVMFGKKTMKQHIVAMDHCEKGLSVEVAPHVCYHEVDVKGTLAHFCFVKDRVQYKVMLETMDTQLKTAKKVIWKMVRFLLKML